MRFRLHPLEEDLLAQLDTSEEKVRRNGFEVPRLSAELLLRHAKQEGYTQQEISAILGLLKLRRFVDIDAKYNLERKIDNVDDLRDRIQDQLGQLENQINQLAHELPEFDKSRYHLGKLQSALDEVKERDELETVNREMAHVAHQLKQFISIRSTSYEKKLHTLRDNLFPW